MSSSFKPGRYFNFEEFENLPSEEKINYADRSSLLKIGIGSARHSYIFSSKKVLKVAVDEEGEKGLAQNQAEIENLLKYKSKFVPKYYEHASDYSWILVELVRPLKSHQEIENFFDIDYEMYYEILDNISAYSSLQDFLNSNFFGRKGLLPNSFIWEPIRKYYNKTHLTITIDDIKKYFLKNKEFVDFINFILSTDLDPKELTIKSNLGINSDSRLIILDLGGTKEVFKTHYAHLLSDQFLKSAKIIHPPINFSFFLKKLIENIDKYSLQIIEDLKPIFALSEELIQNYLYDVFRFRKYIFENLYSSLRNRQLENIKYIYELITDKNSTLEDKNKYASYIIDYLETIKENLNRQKKIFSEELATEKERWKYNIKDQYLINSYSEIPESLVNNIISLPNKLDKILLIIDNAIIKLNEFLRFNTGFYQGIDKRPPSENIEILYHASVNATQIKERGFIQQENKTEGLGGATSGISFTSDLYTAKEIARTLKEVILIAHGQLKGRHILSWSEDEGIKEAVLQSMKDLYAPNSLEAPKDVMNLYKVYLHHSSRYNPLYITDSQQLMDIFAGKNYQDIGIISAKVDMTNSKIQYLASMHEYRVPPEAVIEIIELLK